VSTYTDPDPDHTQEWLDSVDALIAAEGAERASRLLERVVTRARTKGVRLDGGVTTDYRNTIGPESEPAFPGDETLEARIRHFVRWNAAVMVARANHRADGIGGHLATYASAATLYEVGFNHFFRPRAQSIPAIRCSSKGTPRQASTPGRSRGSAHRGTAGRLSPGGRGRLPSYPHPRRSDFWEFPTVSMGLGLIEAAYQARFNRYLPTGASPTPPRPRSGASPETARWTSPRAWPPRPGWSRAPRQPRLRRQLQPPAPRRPGAGQREGDPRVRRAVPRRRLERAQGRLGREWDPLLAADADGVLVEKMNTTLDGEYQQLRVESGAFIREHFFGPDPRLRQLVAGNGRRRAEEAAARRARRGEGLRRVPGRRGTHGVPTVVLAKTVKGWALGSDIEARNATHQIKNMTEPSCAPSAIASTADLRRRAGPGTTALRPPGH